jgi:hypothetical protein
LASIYERPGTRQLYLDYQDARGKRIRRSAKTSNPNLARRRLAAALAAVREERALLYPDAEMPEEVDEAIAHEEQLAALRDQVDELRRRLAYYEAENREYESKLTKIRGFYARKMEYVREILGHAVLQIDKTE